MDYFVSNSGSDANDGLSKQTPFATTMKVNEVVRGGDVVRFRRGDIFYGSIAAVPNDGKLGRTVFAAYGEGPKPVINLYKTAVLTAWESVKKHVWRLDLTDTNNFTGHVFDTNTNVGFMRVDGEIYGRKLFRVQDLHSDWDFYSDECYVYLYCTQDPGGFAVEIACNACAFVLGNYTDIFDLEIVGSGGHGIRGAAKHCTIQNCEIHQIGGAYLPHYIENTRYGNGIELWSDSIDVLIQKNRIYDVYDVAITMQGNEVTEGWADIVIQDNIIWHCEQSFEIWSHGDKNGFQHCSFVNNVCIGAGFGWSHSVRPDRAVAVHLLMYNLKCPMTDITLTNNVFYDARGGLYSKTGASYDIPADYNSDGNHIYLRSGKEICVSGLQFTVEEHKKFSQYFRKEEHSVFSVLESGGEQVTEERIEQLWREKH